MMLNQAGAPGLRTVFCSRRSLIEQFWLVSPEPDTAPCRRSVADLTRGHDAPTRREARLRRENANFTPIALPGLRQARHRD